MILGVGIATVDLKTSCHGRVASPRWSLAATIAMFCLFCVEGRMLHPLERWCWKLCLLTRLHRAFHRTSVALRKFSFRTFNEMVSFAAELTARGITTLNVIIILNRPGGTAGNCYIRIPRGSGNFSLLQQMTTRPAFDRSNPAAPLFSTSEFSC